MKTIKLDFDKPSYPNTFFERMWVLDRLNIDIQRILIRRTPHGYHIKIEIRQDLDDIDILILQLLLGSDYRREFFNYQRIKAGVKNWNILFDKKENTSWLKIGGD